MAKRASPVPALLIATGAALVILIWRVPASRRAAVLDRAHPDAEPETRRPDDAYPAPDPEEPPRDAPPPAALSAPEPVLLQSAQRRFSSPSSDGAAAGGIAGAGAGAAADEARYLPAAATFPGGYTAPVSGSLPPPRPGETPPPSSASAPSPRGEAPTASAPPGARTPPSPAPGGAAPETAALRAARQDAAPDSPLDAKAAGTAGGLVTAAQRLKSRGDAAQMRSASSLQAGIMRQLATDRKVEGGIRDAIAVLEKSGRPVTPEAVAEATQGVLAANGLTADDVDIPSAIARASAPPPKDVPIQAYEAAALNIASAPPLTEQERMEVLELADAEPPPKPRAPAPRGAIDAFRRNEAVFDKALRDYGVKPEHILGILGIETGWGRNTGKYPLPSTLAAISGKTRNGRPTKAAIQAGKDLAALTRLSAEGNLGGLRPDQVRGSYAGAMGIPQFLPTSWEAYSRAPGGGRRDPFDFPTAIYSVANYLRSNGYAKSVPRSVWAYNHSQEYVDKVLNLSADVKASLPKQP